MRVVGRSLSPRQSLDGANAWNEGNSRAHDRCGRKPLNAKKNEEFRATCSVHPTGLRRRATLAQLAAALRPRLARRTRAQARTRAQDTRHGYRHCASHSPTLVAPETVFRKRTTLPRITSCHKTPLEA